MSLGFTCETSFSLTQLGCHRQNRSGLISGENMGSISKSESTLFPEPQILIHAGFLCWQPPAGTPAHRRIVSPKLGCSSISRGWTRKLLIDGSESGQDPARKDTQESNLTSLLHLQRSFSSFFFSSFLFLKKRGYDLSLNVVRVQTSISVLVTMCLSS